ncbi:hypothetical protein K474DRAFT_1606646 [Panus rudis PR-1116 ss-1]|nr:hypothetical protein K474DRAFT_1606646 [Panus rudis PR-1116 ss-1]
MDSDNDELQVVDVLWQEDDRAISHLVLILFLAMEDARLRAVHRRSLHRRYLCRPQLPPTPRAATSWLALYNSRSDRAFITTMGLDVHTFHLILQAGFEYLWDTTPISRSDTNQYGEARVATRSLDAAGGLGLYLHWITSTMRETSLQQIFALIPSTVNRYLRFASLILHATLKSMPSARVCFPEELNEFYAYSKIIQNRHSTIKGAFGSLDGVNIPAQTSYINPELENVTYNGWLHTHCTSSVFAFAPDGTIICAQLNAPGSWHDSRVARNIYYTLRTSAPRGYYLIADTAFPHDDTVVEGHIRVPLKDGARLPDDHALRERVMRFNRDLLSFRQTAEWGMRSLQGGFGRLRIPLDVNNPDYCNLLLENVCRLNNLRARSVGISQIQTVYIPTWRQDDGDALWNQLGEMLIADIRRSDRVSRFHLQVVEELM